MINKNLSNVSMPVSSSSVQHQVKRVIRWFKKSGDDLVGEKDLSNINVRDLQNLFNSSLDNPMYDCYLIDSPEQINYLQTITGIEFDLQLYQYFLECDAI